MTRPSSAVGNDEKTRETYLLLMNACQGNPVEELLARIIDSLCRGHGAMPQWLGLGKAAFSDMIRHHFRGIDPRTLGGTGRALVSDRWEEMVDLEKLLMNNLTSGSRSEAWMAKIVVAGCLGNDHLWQDLGLWKRADLSNLMLQSFKPLAERNDRDMKWKKFLYKQLCIAEGIYTCRAPSCQQCRDYDDCFGPEH